jgi:hypothetical protein
LSPQSSQREAHRGFFFLAGFHREGVKSGQPQRLRRVKAVL